jgi:hypothetical protein
MEGGRYKQTELKSNKAFVINSNLDVFLSK